MTALVAYTKADLRKVHGYLTRLLQPPGGKPLNAEQVVDVGDLRDKTTVMIATHAGKIERGAKVLEWRIPKEIAPTMNEWGFWQMWRKGRARKDLEDRLRPMIAASKGADLCGAQKMRWVRVTRFTLQPKNVDDAAIDAIGGKMPVDTLVRKGVLAGDTATLLKREAIVAKTSRGNTHVLVEVFEIASEEVPDGGPQDGIVQQIARKRGRMTRAITGEE